MSAADLNSKFRRTFPLICMWVLSGSTICIAQLTIPPAIQFGDPFILHYDGFYYMYGTSDTSMGMKVYRSADLQNWEGPVGKKNGFALVKDDVWGDEKFWAPEVYFLNGHFYMFFSVAEHIAVAESDNPLGPFTQKDPAPLLKNNGIDNHLFIDEDGHPYMYFVAFDKGNVIWMCELEEDLKTVKKDTLTKCFGVTQKWEQSQKEPVANIAEGPFVLKHKGLYYLVYSGNHFLNPDYGVGYAVSENPFGPWTKYEHNPIIQSNQTMKGTGHCAFFKDHEGTLRVVFHSHNSPEKVRPRIAHIRKCRFVSQPDGLPDILRIDPDTLTPRLNNPIPQPHK